MLQRTKIFLSVLFFGFCCHETRALKVPTHSGPVVDLAGLLSREQEAQLSQSLLEFQRSHGAQLQLLTIPSLEDETIETYSIKVVDQWKLGAKEKDNGVLLLVAAKERALRIEVGQGLEGQLPDALAGRIISGAMIPLFKQGHIALGIFTGMSAVAENLGGELSNMPKFRVSRNSDKGNPLFFLFFLFIIFFISSLFGRRRGGGGARGLLAGYVIGSVLGGRSSRGSWGGGGGFSGGGGGGFSGGGASGNW